MKSSILFAAVAAILVPCTASAEGSDIRQDVVDRCVAYSQEHGGDEAACPCFGKLAADDAELAAELLAINEPADIEAASDKVTEASKACMPQGGDGSGD